MYAELLKADEKGIVTSLGLQYDDLALQCHAGKCLRSDVYRLIITATPANELRHVVHMREHRRLLIQHLQESNPTFALRS